MLLIGLQVAGGNIDVMQMYTLFILNPNEEEIRLKNSIRLI